MRPIWTVWRACSGMRTKGEARRQRLVGAFAPLDVLPGLGGQAYCKLFGRNRPMIGVVSQAQRLAPPAAPGFGRQELFAGRPERQRRLRPHRIGQPQHRDAGAERPVAAVSHAGRTTPLATPSLAAASILGERDLRLGPKPHVLGNVRRFSTLRRRSPSFPADRADRRSPGSRPWVKARGPNSRDDGDREGHRDLTIVRLAQPAAILLWVLRLSWMRTMTLARRSEHRPSLSRHERNPRRCDDP